MPPKKNPKEPDPEPIEAEVEVVGDDEPIPAPASTEIENLRVAEPIELDPSADQHPDVTIPTGDSFRHFLAMARRYERLPEDEERALGRLALDGDVEARRKLVLHNLKLVIAIAYAYRRTWQNLVDLLQEGSIGLLEAAQRWDPEVGPRFGSYAAYWIRAYILRFLMTNSRLVHTGNTRAGRKLFWRLERERQKLLAAGIDPTPRMLAAKLEVKESDIEEVGSHLDSREMSTDSSYSEDSMSLGDRLVAPGPDPEDLVADLQRMDAIQSLTDGFESTLTDERDVVIWKLHILSVDPVSLAELGKRYGVSRQRMAQIASRVKRNFRKFVEGELGEGELPEWLLDED